MPITHLKVSTITSSSDTSLVRSTDWNSSHVIEGLDSTGLNISRVTGGWNLCVSSANVNITATHTITLDLNIPKMSNVRGVQLRVDAALASGETWDASFYDGAATNTMGFCWTEPVAKNTKINVTQPYEVGDNAGSIYFYSDEGGNPRPSVTRDITDIIIQRNSNPGVDNFTAQGNIKAIVYYWKFATMGDAA